MDARGNLTSPNEFDGVVIQLVSYQPGPKGTVSYLEADLAIVQPVNPDGGPPPPVILEQWVCLQVGGFEPEYLSAQPYLQFRAVAGDGGGFTLSLDIPEADLSPVGFSGIYLSASADGPLVLVGVPVGTAPGADQTFHVDFLQNDCWFSLYYTTDQDYFAGASGTDGFGRPIVAGISWSNAPTQIWRAEVVAAAGAKAARNPDTPAVAAPRTPGRGA